MVLGRDELPERSNTQPSLPKRILVYGVTGSGKTTLARRIAGIIGLPSHSIDDEVGWLPGWVERPREEQRQIVSQIVAGEAWVLDTAYGHWRDLVLPRTELIIGLDYPRRVSLSWLVRRTVRRAISGEDACNGNVETLRTMFSPDSILVWHFRSFARKRTQLAAWEVDPAAPPVVRLGSPRETERWLALLQGRVD
jgi:adenylate kinase family enzyme